MVIEQILPFWSS